ncbi:hypothetical protein AGMMS49975_07420 [Clostridia bacterium]|nr:hypothetical protein AGMMS49975_07420 [Clostridia bacterium]
MNSQMTATRKIAITALFVAMAAVVKLVSSQTLDIVGAPILRIGFPSGFTRFTAILLGPLYGGIAGGLEDVVGYLLKPTGAYLLPLTIVEVVKNALVGFSWFRLRDKLPFGRFVRILIVSAPVCLFFTTVNTFLFRYVFGFTHKAFLVYLMPRLGEEIVSVIVSSYLISLYLMVYEKHIQRGL